MSHQLSSKFSSATVGFPFCRANAFTVNPLGGNPAAIVLLDSSQDQPNAKACDYFFNADWCASVAQELALAETAFILAGFHIPPASTSTSSLSHSSQATVHSSLPNMFSIRWFALDGREERLCGHATLASAHFLYSSQLASPDSPIHFYSHISGPLIAHLDSSEKFSYFLDFPAKVSLKTYSAAEFEKHQQVTTALGIKDEDVVRYDESELDLIIEVKRDDIVISANSVNFGALGAFPRYRGFLLTSAAASGRIFSSASIDFVSRCFFHSVGEDSATGSAHCALVCYWQERLKSEGKKQWYNAWQASKRGGLLKVATVEGENEAGAEKGKRVLLKGNVVSVIDGHITLPALPRVERL